MGFNLVSNYVDMPTCTELSGSTPLSGEGWGIKSCSLKKAFQISANAFSLLELRLLHIKWMT
jgi:hypothetical protein